MYEKSVLNNSLRVITHKMSDRKSVAVGIWIGVGGRYEDRTNKGIAHFLEHLLFKGSKKYSCDAIKESIEGVGGLLNGFTSEEFTCYLTKIPVKYLDSALKILSDMTITPLLLEKDIERERFVIIEEIKMYQDQPQHCAQELLDNLLWPDHPLGMNLSGTVDSVKGISQGNLFDFKNKFYLPFNMTVAVSGDLEHKDVVDSVGAIFSSSQPKETIDFLRFKSSQNSVQIKLSPKNIQQVRLALGMHSLWRDHPDRYTLVLLNIILGANMSSRLFREVREKRGLAYDIHTYIKLFNDTGAFVVQAGIDKQKVFETIEVILRELSKIKSEGPKVEELTRAKEYYIGQFILSLEDTLDHMLWIGEQTMALDKVYTLEDVIDKIKKVTASDIIRVAKDIFQERKFNLALVGPNLENQEDKIKELLCRS